LKTKIIALILITTISLSFSYTVSKDIQVYFTTPYSTADQLKNEVLGAIKNAKNSIHMAVYSLKDYDVINLLREKIKEGLNVEIAMEAGNVTFSVIGLKKLGAKLYLDDNDRALTHDKFIIIDGKKVITGSTNFTPNGFEYNCNNSLFIRSKSVAEDFEREFDNFRNGKFHNEKVSDGKFDFIVDGIKVEIYFSPEDMVRDKIFRYLSTVNHNLYFAIYAFSDYQMANTFELLKSKGCRVYGIMDEDWDGPGGYGYDIYKSLSEDNIDVELDNNKDGLWHNKFIVIDAETNSDPMVLTGSYNFTLSANYKNDENLIVIHSAKAAEIYENYFKEWWKKR
jgi:phosphatidylserine/phosphatidylglycerophosphate/cardiolipin synthase-like enzyme